MGPWPKMGPLGSGGAEERADGRPLFLGPLGAGSARVIVEVEGLVYVDPGAIHVEARFQAVEHLEPVDPVASGIG